MSSSIQTIHHSEIDTLLEEQRQYLRNNPLFLGNPALLNHVEWDKKDTTYDALINKRQSNTEPSQLADVVCIAEISKDKYWMIPGAFATIANREIANTDAFTRQRGSLRLFQLRKKALTDLWKPTLDGIKNLLTSVPNPRSRITHTIIENGEFVRVRHEWFEVYLSALHLFYPTLTTSQRIPPDEAEYEETSPEAPTTSAVTISSDAATDTSDDVDKTAAQLDAQYGIQTWNMCESFDWAQQHLQRIIEDKQLRGIPLPAFDLRNAKALHPNECESALKGALAKVTMNITRQRTWDKDFEGHNRDADAFYADISQITVVLPPGYEDIITSSAKRRGMNLPDDIIAAKKKIKK
ncbi:hypothetical protein SCP_0213300 [Sparassis crispa]|uniref:Uncharacterized protein n=1 Tax=Sparassis crispa TaxID=139825 RepID=A0A401GD87_9APHY|nr:hypothetical protein SCP_0213300 [Sparassis crispa]GBE80127.1 hypothetical protein SCP_0213300 [Sparassis crispa]